MPLLKRLSNTLIHGSIILRLSWLWFLAAIAFPRLGRKRGLSDVRSISPQWLIKVSLVDTANHSIRYILDVINYGLLLSIRTKRPSAMLGLF